MTSSSWVSWLITCECQPADFTEIVNLATEMTGFVSANEPETTHFEWSVASDHASVQLHERYADSNQAMAHMKAFGEHFGSRFMALLKPKAVTVYGFPSADLRSQLEGLSPQYTEFFAGFAR